MLEELLMAFINGILLGGVLALLAFGLNLIFGVVKIIHMAYGQFVMLGFYFIYYFHTAWHMPLLVAMAAGIVVMGLFGHVGAAIDHQSAAERPPASISSWPWPALSS